MSRESKQVVAEIAQLAERILGTDEIGVQVSVLAPNKLICRFGSIKPLEGGICHKREVLFGL